MTGIDLEPAAQRMSDLVRDVPEERFDSPTPCPDYTLGDLVEHVAGLTIAFTGAARKDTGEATSQSGSGDASRLDPDWRTKIPRDLTVLAEAWRAPDAWTGMTKAGGIELPGEVAGMVALDELVVHAWDVARASGQSYDPDEPSLEAVHAFVAEFAGPGQEALREGIFGPPVDVSPDAPLLDRVIGLTGRDPAWSPR
jgi:uncharacterized protein (TIGR03086 family)